MQPKSKSKNAYEFQESSKLDFLVSAKQALSQELQEEYKLLYDTDNRKNVDDKQFLQQKIRQLSIAKILVSSYDHDIALLIESHTQLAEVYNDSHHIEQAYEHYKSAYDKLVLVDNDEYNEKNLRSMILQQLISTSFKLSNYHRSLAYIDEFNKIMDSDDNPGLDVRSSRFYIDGIKARVLYELGDVREAEALLKNNLKFIENSHELKKMEADSMDNKTLTFNNKCEIYNILYKIYKNEKDHANLLEILNEGLKYIELTLGKGLDEFIFKFEQIKFLLRKIFFLQDIEEANVNKKIAEELQRVDDIVVELADNLDDISKNNLEKLLTKKNQQILTKIKTLCTNQFIIQIKAKDFLRAHQLIEILRVVNRFIYGENSQEHAKTLYLCVKCMVKNRADRNLIYKYCKRVLKICKQNNFDELFSKTRQVMTTEIDNTVVDISLTEITNIDY